MEKAETAMSGAEAEAMRLGAEMVASAERLRMAAFDYGAACATGRGRGPAGKKKRAALSKEERRLGELRRALVAVASGRFKDEDN